MRLFRRVVPTGIKHGTVSVITGEHAFEVTTYRADGKYLDGRHPENVRFSKTLKEDVARRDFTINGLAYDVMKDEVVDLAGGLEDIEKRIIRTIGDPYERFTKDGLKDLPGLPLRGASRLCNRGRDLFGHRQEPGRRLQGFHGTGPGRAHEAAGGGTPSVGFEHMRKSGLLDIVLPELSSCHGALQNKYHMYDIYYHSLYSCDAAPREKPLIRLASLLHDLGKLPTRREGEDGDYSSTTTR